MSTQDGIVLLHGIFRTWRSMCAMARFLEAKGYRVLNQGYPSTRYSLEELADIIHPDVEAFSRNISGRVHFVGYSMGGLLIRTYLHAHPLEKLGRVVMAGTPNQGSEVADLLKPWWLYRTLYGPAGQQLICDQSGFCHIFGPVDYELGVIAGNRPLDLFGSYIIGKENDGKVSVDSTRLAGMRAHVVIPVNHTLFPANRIMWQLAVQFIQTGVMRYTDASS